MLPGKALTMPRRQCWHPSSPITSTRAGTPQSRPTKPQPPGAHAARPARAHAADSFPRGHQGSPHARAKPDRALPPWAVGFMRQGTHQGTDRAAWGRCVAIAMSAQARSWTYNDFSAFVTTHGSILWMQLSTRRNGDPKNPKAVFHELKRAWEAARLNLHDVGERTRADVDAEAVETAFAWQDAIAGRSDEAAFLPLDTAERLVVNHIAQEVEKWGWGPVTAPLRAIAEATGLGIGAVRGAVERLVEGRVIDRVSRGLPGKGPMRRSAVYRLVCAPQDAAHSSHRKVLLCEAKVEARKRPRGRQQEGLREDPKSPGRTPRRKPTKVRNRHLPGQAAKEKQVQRPQQQTPEKPPVSPAAARMAATKAVVPPRPPQAARKAAKRSPQIPLPDL
jgi:hypothetical protein